MSLGKFFYKNRGKLGTLFMALIFILTPKASWNFFLTGLILILFGELIRFLSVSYIGVHSRGEKLEAPVLVKSGPYRFTRNPIYLGNFLIGLGILWVLGGGVILITSLFVFLYWLEYGLIIRAEEKFLKAKFENEYEEYARKVPRLIPTLKPNKPLNQKINPNYKMGIKSEIPTLFLLLIGLVAGYLKILIR